MTKRLYKIFESAEWEIVKDKEYFLGSELDILDGFIHFSTLEQIKGTIERHFKGKKSLCLIEVKTDNLNIIWEKSRNNELFPHLYDALPIKNVTKVYKIKRKKNAQILPNRLLIG